MKSKIRGMFSCNSCRTGRCSSATFKMYEKMGDSSSCTLYDREVIFRMPLLVHVLSSSKDTKSITNLLAQFGYVIRELSRYPFFELIQRKK